MLILLWSHVFPSFLGQSIPAIGLYIYVNSRVAKSMYSEEVVGLLVSRHCHCAT
jgi:hypothetical protein